MGMDGICLNQLLADTSTISRVILNHWSAAKTTEKSWSLTTNSKFSAICCWAASMLHPNEIKVILDDQGKNLD